MPKTPIDENLIWVNVVAGCLIEKDSKFLLVQEKNKAVYGLWNLPAGKVEKEQTIEATAIREAKEETGLDVEIIRKIGIYHKDGDKSVKHAFEARIIGGDVRFPEDEILDAKWFSSEEMTHLKENGEIRSGWAYAVLQDK